MNTPKLTTLRLSAAAFALSAAFAVLPGAIAQKKAPAKTATKAATDTLTIINSGDRLSPGYRVTVTASGAVQGIVRTRTGKVTINRKGQMIGPTRDRLFEDLHGAEPLNRLSTGNVPAAPQTGAQERQQGRRGRRGGFGNRTQTTPTYTNRVTGPQVFVVYHGVRSPNLRAASDDKGKELYQRVKQAIEVVRLPIPDVP